MQNKSQAQNASPQNPTNPNCIGQSTVDGKRVGVWWCFYPSGRLRALVEYVGGLQNGSMDHWLEDGRKDFETEWKNNFLHGKSKLFLGQACPQIESTYDEGRFEGPVVHRDQQCHTRIVMNYVNGVLSGEYLEFWSNGKSKVVGQYIKGKEEGLWTFTDCQGNPVKTEDELDHLSNCPKEELTIFSKAKIPDTPDNSEKDQVQKK